jgi:hypothetical protein
MRRSIGTLVALALSSVRVSANAESPGAALNLQGQNLSLFISIAAINRGEHEERFFVIGGYELTAMHVFVGSLSLLVGFLGAAAFKLARCPPWCHGAFLGVWYLTMMYTLPATNPWLKAIQDAMWNPASLARKLARKLR